MSLTLTESSNLMRDMELQGRIKVAALKYATFVQGGPVAATTLSVSRWAQSTMTNPDQAAMQLIPLVVMDVAVQDAGRDITDEALQTATETVIKKMI